MKIKEWKITKASIIGISAYYPNSLIHANAQPYEDITIRYESISWAHICAGMSGDSISQNIYDFSTKSDVVLDFSSIDIFICILSLTHRSSL